MKFVFISNYYTHHQQPFCDAMYQRLEKEFHFIATTHMEDERKAMGWNQEIEKAYVVDASDNSEKKKNAETLIAESEVIMIGACSQAWFDMAISSSAKVIFQYGERLFKNGFIHAFGSGAFKYRLRYQNHLKNRNAYMLCASAYLPVDLRLLGVYKNRCYRWGYFPEVRHYDNVAQLIQRKKPRSFLWTGRMIDWKHPEDAVVMAHQLREQGYSFSMNMIGDGPQKAQIKEMIEKWGLQNYVQLLPFMEPEKVRSYMEQADIYLFTSDKNEGWGAVLNESMNSGCAVIANQMIGSAPYLISNQVNGLLYNRNKKNSLLQAVLMLLNNPQIKNSYQLAAYQTITAMWNAEVAAKRLIMLSEHLAKNEEIVFQNGPCSKASKKGGTDAL